MASISSRYTEARKTTSPQRESTGHGTASQCPSSAETNNDVNATMQTGRQQYNLSSWLTQDAEPAGRKRKDNRPRSGSTL
jgi:hypothetical protein